MYKLVISDDEGKTTVVPFIRDEITIGRKEGNTIRLTERNVSREHARLRRETEDTFVIEDLGSRCGTKINADKLSTASATITPGDQITIGDYSLSIRTDVAAAVPLGRQMDPGEGAGIGKVTPHARLVMLNGPTPGKEIDLTAQLYVIGRSEEANLRIQDPSISRAHARIDGDEGKWTLSDLDSNNGIFINGLRRDDYLLKPGDIIEMGTVQLRFVAPGEPYEFIPPDEAAEAAEDVAPGSRKKLIVLLVAAGAVAVVVIIALLIVLGSGEDSSAGGSGDEGAEMSFAQLMEAGKDGMQQEDWGAAAGYFARALMKDGSSKSAREMKQLAISEADAQQSFTKGLAAGERQDWQAAVDHLASISRSSHYYDHEQLVTMSGKLCEELVEKARFLARTGNLAEAREVLRSVEDIPEAPDTCGEARAAAQRDLASAVEQRSSGQKAGGAEGSPAPLPSNPYDNNPYRNPQAGGGGGAAAPASGGGGGAKNPYDNPYGSDKRSGGQVLDDEKPPGKPAPKGISWDPIQEARAAVQRNDKAGAIAILEKAGNGRQVLGMLADLYRSTGRQDKYERTARKFITLYPDHPWSTRFRKSLGM